MTTQLSTKVRLVTCPRCRLILTEPSEHPLYKCGGCGTILESKSWRNGTNHDGVHLQETNRVLESEPHSILKENEASISNLDLTPFGGKSLPDGDKPRDQGESGDYNGEQCEDTSFSCELSSSREVSGYENKDLSKVVIEQLKQDKEGKCPLGQNAKRCESEFQDCNGEKLAGRHSSAEFPSSSECTSHEAGVSTPEIREHVESHDKNPSEQCTGRDQKEYGDSRTECCGSENFLDQVESLPEHDHQKYRLPPDGEHGEGDESSHLSPEKNNKSLNSCGDYNGEQCENRSLSHVVSGCENKDLSTEVIEQLKLDKEGRCPLGKNAEICESGFQDCNGGSIAGGKPCAEFPTSSEFASREVDVSTPEVREHVESGDKNPSEQCTGRDQREYGDSQTELCTDNNSLDEVRSLPEHDQRKNKLPPDGREHREGDESTHLSPENNEKGLNRFRGQNGGLTEEMDNNRQGSSSFEIALHENGNSSLSAGGMAEVNKDIENLSLFRSSSTENYVNADTGDSLATAQGPSNENDTSVNCMSPDTEQLEHSHREDTRSFGRVSSIETLDSSPPIDPSSKLGVKNVDMSKSPTTKSYYAYEGSVSSYDGTDDQISAHVSPLSRRKFKDKVSTSTAELHRKDGLVMNNKRSSESEMQYWAASSLSVLQGKQYHAMEGGSSWHQVELPETRRHGHKSGTRMRLDKEEAASRLAFTSRDFQDGHKIGSLSSYKQSLHQNHQAYRSSDRSMYSEPDKMDLLRTVCELKDQLNRMQFSKLMANGRLPAGVLEEKLTPSYYDHLAPEREMYADLSHPRYPVRHGLSKGWPQRCKDSRMAFSGEAPHYRQVNCSCLHCCPQDWHRSAQLPSHSKLCNNGHCMVHTGHNCCDALGTSSSSPQHYTSSEHSLWGHETISDDRRHKDTEMKRLYLREKHHITRQHLRPISGGAPLISCYHCSELLQLPSDSLLFKKKYHQLRCNACGKVLKFSLLERMHIVPYIPEASAPPPSEADDYSDAISQRNPVPTSHANSCPHADPVSCSDDYGRSFCRSCSTEGEASFLTPSVDRLEWNAYNRKMSSGSSYETMEDRKMKSVLRGHGHKNKSLVETSKPAEASSKTARVKKVSSEIEELPAPSNSPLHRLMGYSSPSQVLNK